MKWLVASVIVSVYLLLIIYLKVREIKQWKQVISIQKRVIEYQKENLETLLWHRSMLQEIVTAYKEREQQTNGS